MNIKCSNCHSLVNLEENQIKLIDDLKSKGISFGMIKCSSCGLSFSINPQNLNYNVETNQQKTWRSPISGSHGFVSYIEDEDRAFYGCSETGAIWYNKDNFFIEIKKIIERYPHRNGFYDFLDGEWYPAENEPDDIIQLIDSEDRENLTNYVRG